MENQHEIESVTLFTDNLEQIRENKQRVLRNKRSFLERCLNDGLPVSEICRRVKIDRKVFYSVWSNTYLPKISPFVLSRQALSRKIHLLEMLKIPRNQIATALGVTPPTLRVHTQKPTQLAETFFELVATKNIPMSMGFILRKDTPFILHFLETGKTEILFRDNTKISIVITHLHDHLKILDAFPLVTRLVKSKKNPFFNLEWELPDYEILKEESGEF
jgi:hypothetical protein